MDVEDLVSPESDDHADIVVIGAGVVGCALARELAKYKAKVVVLEAANDVATGASKANSGIVHGGYDELHGTVKSQVARAGNRMFRKLSQELGFGFRVLGSLVVAFDEEERSVLESLRENGRKNGVHGLRILPQAELRALEPHISPQAKFALHCPHTGVTSPYEYAFALAENAIANGVEFRLFREVVAVQKRAVDGRFHVKFRDTRQTSRSFGLVRARYVINCAGLRSDQVAAMVGANNFEILPRKGEYLILEKTQAEMANHVLFPVPSKTLGKGVLVSRTFWGNLLIGPTSRPPNEILSNNQIIRDLVRSARRLVPDVDVSRVLTSYSGNRAKSDRRDFIIEESGKVPGFINVAGIDSPGLTSSPAVALRVCHLLTALTSRRALQEDFRLEWKERGVFQPTRKPIVLSKIGFRGAIDHPDPAKNVICRCERITEAEILDALDRPLTQPTITSLKRRTRAGMGSCQGKFCQERVAAVIAKKLQIPVEQVADLEPGSSLLPHRRVTEEDRTFLKRLVDEEKAKI